MKGAYLAKIWFWGGVVLYAGYKLIDNVSECGVMYGEEKAYNKVLDMLYEVKNEKEDDK